MSEALALVMVGAAGLCVCGVAVARRWASLVAPAVMLAAMVDIAYIGAVAPILWACALVLAGIGVAVSLRATETAPAAPAAPTAAAPQATAASQAAAAPRSRPRLGRTVVVLSAVSYPIMAWQLMQHGGAAGGTGAPIAAGAHVGHGADASLPGLFMSGAALVLVLLFAVCAAIALGRGRRHLALEAIGMGTMLAVMLLPH